MSGAGERNRPSQLRNSANFSSFSPPDSVILATGGGERCPLLYSLIGKIVGKVGRATEQPFQDGVPDQL